MLETLGKRDRAIAGYDMALRLAPRDASLYRERGNARRSQGDWAGAIADFSRSLEIDPGQDELYVSRGWSLLIADRDGAEADARAFLDRQRGDPHLIPYMSILGALASRRAGHEDAASAFLDEGLAGTPPLAWPAPVLRSLKRRNLSGDTIDSAPDGQKKTEAHVFVGLDLLYAGDRQQAVEHLVWARPRRRECDRARPRAGDAPAARSRLSAVATLTVSPEGAAVS